METRASLRQFVEESRPICSLTFIAGVRAEEMLIRVEKDGYVYPPTKPGIGYEVDYDKLDDITIDLKR